MEKKMFAFKRGDIISYNVSDAICHKPGEVFLSFTTKIVKGSKYQKLIQ